MFLFRTRAGKSAHLPGSFVTKGEGKKDILKVIHYAQLLLELEYPEEDKQADLFNDLIERGKHVQVKS